MHKVEELENRWINYKIKQIILPAIKVSSLYLVFVGGYYVYNKSDISMSFLSSAPKTNVLGVSMDANNSVVAKVPSLQKPIVKKEIKERSNAVEKIALAPIVPVIDMEKEERISDVKKVKSVKRHTKKHSNTQKQKSIVKAKKNAYLTPQELAVIRKDQKKLKSVPRETKKIHFTSTSTNYIETMKQKFSQSKSPRDALLLSKTYYKNANYSEAEKWALSANKLDNSLEDSWLIFAKSKVKLGKKKEALKILVSYYKKSHSSKAKQLIGQIKTGKI